MTMLLVGDDAGAARDNDRASIQRGAPWRLHYVHNSDNGLFKRWYNNYPPCDSVRPPGMQCDEYPFYSTNESGAGNPLNRVGPGLVLAPAAQNMSESPALRWMPDHCELMSGRRAAGGETITMGSPYLVVVLPDRDLSKTTYICGSRS